MWFSLESTPTYLCHSTKGYIKSKKHQKKKDAGLANEGRHNLLLLHKQARGIAESLHVYIHK